MIHVSNSIVLSALDLRLIMHRKSRSMSKRWMRTEFTAGPVLSTTCTTTEKRAASGPRFVAGCPCPDSKAQPAARLAVQVSELRTRLNNIEFSPKLRGARSRLYRRRFLQANTRWKALAEIYTMHSFAPFSNLNFFVKNRQKKLRLN